MKHYCFVLFFILTGYTVNANSALITTQELVVVPSEASLIEGEAADLFRVVSLGILDPMFDASSIFAREESILGFRGTSVINSVEMSEVANSDGTIERTSSNIRTTTTRELTNVSISDIFDLDGFGLGNLSFNAGALFLDFSGLNVLATSILEFDITFSSESVRDVLSQETSTVQPDNSNNAVSVSEPSALFLLLIGTIAAVRMRGRKTLSYA